MGVFITRGVDADGLDLKKKWEFVAASVGDDVTGGQVLEQYEDRYDYSQDHGPTKGLWASSPSNRRIQSHKRFANSMMGLISMMQDGRTAPRPLRRNALQTPPCHRHENTGSFPSCGGGAAGMSPLVLRQSQQCSQNTQMPN